MVNSHRNQCTQYLLLSDNIYIRERNDGKAINFQQDRVVFLGNAFNRYLT